MENPKRILIWQKGKLKILWTGKKKGYAVFAATDIRKGDFISEYKGKIIPYEDSDTTNQTYNISTMLDIQMKDGVKYAIDGLRRNNKSGTFFKDFENVASYLNHEYYNPTCMLKYIDDKPCLVAREDIPAEMELSWCYNCPGGKRPDFYYNGKYVKVKLTN